MIERPVAAGLLALPFVYLSIVLLPAFPSGAVGVAGAFAVTLFIAGLTGLPGAFARDLGAGVGIALSLFFALTVGEPATFGDTSAALAVGVLLGIPWIAWAYVWRDRESLANRLVAYGFALTLGTLLLTALAALRAARTGVTPDSFVSGFYLVNSQQLQGIAALLSGSGPVGLPAHNVFDATFAGLLGMSALGLLLLVLRPGTGDGRPLPIRFAARSEQVEHPELSPLLGFSESQRAAFLGRTAPEAPVTVVPPGLAAVVSAAFATALLVGVAFLLPYWALLAATVGLAGAAGVLALVADLQYRSDSGVSGEPPTPTAPPPSASRTTPPLEPASPSAAVGGPAARG